MSTKNPIDSFLGVSEDASETMPMPLVRAHTAM